MYQNSFGARINYEFYVLRISLIIRHTAAADSETVS